jgi:hypothetical protein
MAGTYTITLKVTDENGGVSTPRTVSVSVPTSTALPVPRFTTTVNKLSVAFDASTSTDDFGTISLYFWTFGDSTTETTEFPTVTHVFPNVNNYNVILEVTNNRTAKASLTKSVTTLNNIAPSALIPTPTIVGYDVTVSSASTDSDGTIA